MTTEDAQMVPAPLGPVERMVRPGAEAPTLVERLRARLAGSICNPDGTYTVGNCPPDALSQEAADEIESMPAAIEAARMAGVHSVQEQTAVIVRAALELLEAVEGCEGFPPEKMAAFRRVFGA